MKTFCTALTLFACVALAADDFTTTGTTTAAVTMNGDAKAEDWDLATHIKTRHESLQMAYEMVEMFCTHAEDKPDGKDDGKDGDKDGTDGDKDGRNLADDTTTTAAAKAAADAMANSTMDTNAMENMDFEMLHKLYDDGEKLLGMENHWLCNQALDIYEKLIDAAHDGDLMYHHEEDFQNADGKGSDAVVAAFN